LVDRVRSAVISSRKPNGTWSSFWWATDVYATVWATIFLGVSGGVSAEIRNALGNWISSDRKESSPLEVALLLMLCSELRIESPMEMFVHKLADAFVKYHWPGSKL